MLIAALFFSVSVQASNTNFNWIATSPSDDYSTASDWDTGYVPNGTTNCVVLLTNGVTCNYNSPDANFIGQMQLAPWDNSSGTFVMNGGLLVISNNDNLYPLIVGGGETTNTASLTAGVSGLGGTASLTVNGGGLTVVRNTSTEFQDGFIVGMVTNSTGTVTVNGGVVTVLCGLEMGLYGSGTLNLNGGAFVDNGWFGVGRGNSGPHGSAQFNMTGGALYVLRNAGTGQHGISVAQAATNAIVNVSGGTLYAEEIVFNGTTATEQLNVSGGNLYLGYGGVAAPANTNISVTISGGTFHTVDLPAPPANGNTNFLADGTNWLWAANAPVNLTNSSYLVNGTAGPGYVTFAPEANRTITLSNLWSGVGGLDLNGPGNLALDAAEKYTGGTTISQGNLILNSGGSFVDPSLALPAGSALVFNEGSTINFTNVLTGPGNVLVNNGNTTVNVGDNLQNSGAIVISNGALVVSGSILNASAITNASSTGPLVAQGSIDSPITINANASFETGSTASPGTLNASNMTLNGTWTVKINTPNTPGGGTNDLLLCTNLTLGPGSILNVAPLTLPSAGNYIIAQYSGSLTGTFGLVTNTSRGSMSVNYGTPGEIILTVGAVSPANLTWAGLIGSADINWDVNTSSNWTNTATMALDKFQQQDAVTFGGTPGATPLTNRVAVTGVVLPSSVTITGGLPYVFSGGGQIGGGASVTYDDTNTSGIYTSGNDFTGPVNINNGILQLGSGGSSWLGTTNGPTIVNGGTLDLDGQSVGAEPLIIQGAGAAISGTNGGAINNSSSTEVNQSGGPLNITLAGDTTLNASGQRWDIGINKLGAGGGSFVGNGYNLTKIGNQAIYLHEVGDIGVSNIDIQQGSLGFQFTVGMGLPAGTVTVESGATLDFYQLSSGSILDKNMVLNGNATLFSGGGAGTSNNFVGPIVLNGTNSIQTSGYPLYLGGAISGTGGFTLTGAGPLYMGGVNTYSGPTIMAANSHLVLDPGSSINDTPLIYLAPGSNTLLDAGTGVLTLNSGQTLVGAGAVIATNVVEGPGSTISPGTNLAYGAILFTNNLTLDGGTNIVKISDSSNIGVDNDLILANNTINLAAVSTLEILPLAALNSSSPYTVMEAYAGVSGPISNLRVISLSPRYTMTPSINGQLIQINVAGNAASLLWQGYLTPNWDLGTSNWLNLGTGSHDTFFNGDDPIFDDSASVTTVSVPTNVVPAGIYMSNVVNTYTFDGGGVIGGQLNMYGNGSGQGGTTILALSNAPAFTTIDDQCGTLVYNLQGITNYFVNAVIEDTAYTGAGRIVFGGTNTAVLTADNYDAGYDGVYWVTNGVLRYTNQDAFGVAPEPFVVTNSGTLDINGVPLGSGFTIHIAGSGFNGMGALFDSKNNALSSDNPTSGTGGGFVNLVLDGDASIGSPGANRLDQNVPTGQPGQVNGQGFKLTKVGTGTVIFYQQADGDTHFGDIDVAEGRLGFQDDPPSGYSVAMGVVTDLLSVESNATITFYAVSNGLDPDHAGLDKVMWLKGDATVDSGGNSAGSSNNFIGPVFLTGTNMFGTRVDLHLWNGLADTNGPGGFVLGNDSVGASGGDLWLDGTNSYSGATIISNRTVHVGANSSLGLSTFVQVNSGATLDLSAMSVFNFGTTATNQTLIGAGTVEGPAGGNININAGGTVAPGLLDTNGVMSTNTFSLTVNGSLVFNSGSVYEVGVNKTNPNPGTNNSDHIVGLTSVTMGGTLIVTNYGTSFVAGDAFPVFSATTYLTNGLNIVPAAPGPNLAWDTSTLGADGRLRVISTLVINTNPVPMEFSISGNNLTLSWPADHMGWELQAQTNSLSVGISTNWAPVSGSTGEDSVVIPISLTNGSVFYRLVYPPQ